MSTTLVHIRVRAEDIPAFIAATELNCRASRKEEGNLRFDLLQEVSDPSRFILYESYRSEEEAKAHKTTPHYLEWRERVAGMMEEPRVGLPFRVLSP